MSDEDPTQEIPVFVKLPEEIAPDTIDEWIRNKIEEQNKRIEETIEMAIQSGEYGVKIVQTTAGLIISCEVDSEVPYGRMHIFEEE